MKRHPFVTILVAAVAVSRLHQDADAQSVIVLTNGTGGALQAAINVAADGDTILLHGGNYSACVIDGKALRIVAEPTNGTTVESMRVTNLPSGKLFTLAGLKVWATFQPPSPPPAVWFQDCAGSVRVDELQTTGVVTSRSGLAVYGCPDLVITNTISKGGPGSGVAYLTGSGLEAGGSRIAVYDTTLDGGNGSNATYDPPWWNVQSVRGGHGLRTYSPGFPSEIFVSGVTARGGTGGNSSQQPLPGGGCAGYSGVEGGTGMRVLDGTVFERDTTAIGGAGGTSWCPSFSPGQSGPPTSGSINSSHDLRLGLRSSPAVREKQPIPITVTGTPGETVALFISQQAEFKPDANGSNVRLVPLSARRVDLGVVPPSGTLFRTIRGVALPPTSATATWLMQVVAVEATGALRFGASVPLVVLDYAY